MEQAQEQRKWEGKATAKLEGATAEQVWPLLEDFGNLHKWHPGVDTCHLVEGDGLIRYCAATSKKPPPSQDDGKPGSDDDDVMWCKEKLLEMDKKEMRLSYEVVDNNIGMKRYVACLRVVKGDDEDDNEGGCCLIEWSFEADPMDGFTCQAFCKLIESSLCGMVKVMEKAFETT